MRRARGVVAVVCVLLAVGLAAWLLLAPADDRARAPRGGTGARAGSVAASEDAAGTRRHGSAATAARPAGRGVVLGRVVTGIPSHGIAAAVRIEGAEGFRIAARAGDDGLFRVAGLPVGALLSAVVVAPGFAERRIDVLIPTAGTADLGDVDVGPDASLVVRVRDTEGRPLAAKVRLGNDAFMPLRRWQDDIFHSAAEALRPTRAPAGPSGATDEHGVWRAAVAPGWWSIEVASAGRATLRTGAQLAEAETQTVEVILPPGHVLAGTLVTSDGAAVAGVPVRLSSRGAPSASEFVTDEHGRFRIGAAPAGDVPLVCVLDGCALVELGSVRVPDAGEVVLMLPPLGSFKGRVVDAATGGGVAGAEVVVDESSLAVTDADGAFAFERIAVGKRETAVRATEYRPFPWTLEEKVDVVVPRGGTAEALFRLQTGAVLRGRVLGPDGAGVPGASLDVLGNGTGIGRVQTVAATRADGDGRYEIAALPAGLLLVHVEAPALCCTGYPADEWEAFDAGALPPAWTVEMPQAGEVRRDFALGAGAAVAGVVLRPEGGPAEGADVEAGPRWGDTRPARTGPGGKFRIEHVLPSDTFVVAATAQGGMRAETDPFSLADGATAGDLVLELAPTTVVVTGRVADAEGAPVPGAWLRWQPYEMGGDPVPALRRARSAELAVVAEDGSFRFENRGRGDGDLSLFAGAPGFAVEALAWTTTGGPAEIRLQREVATRGIVVDADGRACAGAIVRAEPWSGNYTADRETPLVAVCGADGRFVLHAVHPPRSGSKDTGSWRVAVDAPGFVREVQRFEPGGDEEIRVVLQRGLTLSGRVTDAATGGPIVGLWMYVVHVDHSRFETQTDADGRWHVDGLSDAPVIVVAGPSWADSSIDVVTETRNDVLPSAGACDFALQPGLSIRGHIVGEDGRPLAVTTMIEVFVASDDEDEDSVADGMSRADGTFRLRGFEPGSYTVVLSPWSDDLRGERVADVRPGGAELVLRARAAGRISVRVVPPAGGDLGRGGEVGAKLAGAPREDDDGDTWSVGSNGRCTIGQLDPSAAYDVEASGFEGFLPARAKGVKPGGAEVVLALVKAGAISGKVVGPDGAGLPGALVHAEAVAAPEDAPGRASIATAAADGTFTVKGLGPFRFALRVEGGPDPAPVHEPGETVEIRVTK